MHPCGVRAHTRTATHTRTHTATHTHKDTHKDTVASNQGSRRTMMAPTHDVRTLTSVSSTYTTSKS